MTPGPPAPEGPSSPGAAFPKRSLDINWAPGTDHRAPDAQTPWAVDSIRPGLNSTPQLGDPGHKFDILGFLLCEMGILIPALYSPEAQK